MDKETSEVYSEGQMAVDFIKSKEWTWIKKLLGDKIIDMQSVLNIKRVSPTDMAREVWARQMATDILFEVLKDVEGMAEKHEANVGLMSDPTIINY